MTDLPSPVLSPLLAGLDGVRHGFFGRPGGVSAGIYTGLNAGPGSADRPEAVAENRRRVASQLGVAADRLLSAHQYHSAIALQVEDPFAGERPRADGLVTQAPCLAVTALAADCAPILFADSKARVVAACHAGWRGALGGIIEATIETMLAAGARRGQIVAAIGPCIGQASYETGPEFFAAFVAVDAANARFFAPGQGDRRQFDLPGFCLARLAASGIAAAEALFRDTFAEPDQFFSHRRAVKAGEGDYGRNLSAITLV